MKKSSEIEQETSPAEDSRVSPAIGLFRGAKAQFESESQDPMSPSEPDNSANAKSVFVVHGRNDQLRDSMFQFLRSIGLKPMEWAEALAATGKATPIIADILDSALRRAKAVVVLLSPDDEARLRSELQRENEAAFETQLTGQARPNVLFEAGMAFGRCPDRTILVEVGSLRPFSDVAGRHVVRLNNSAQTRKDLADRLQRAGCDVDLSGSDWLRVGDFEIKPVAPPRGTFAYTSVPRPKRSIDFL